MTTEYSISVNDWQNERWNHVGVNLMYNYYMEDKETKEECKEYDSNLETIAREKADEHYPIMLYAYPLGYKPSDNKIIKVCTKTNCTVVEDIENGEYFLALSGGGMDLSQDIALSYLIIQGWIPTALAINVCTQPELSVNGKDWLKIMRAIKSRLRTEIGCYKSHTNKINQQIRKFKEITKERKRKEGVNNVLDT